MKNDQTLTTSELNSRIYEVVEATFGETSSTTKASEVLSRIVPNERGQYPEKVVFLSRKFVELLGYLIILHNVDDEILFWYLFLDLQEHLRRNHQFYWLFVLSEKKDYFLEWLVKQQTITTRAFFGNICCRRNLETCWRSIVFRFEKRIKPRRVQRHRGYRDKGTLPKLDERVRRKEVLNDSWLKEIHLKLEEEKLLQEKNIRLFRSYLEGHGSLAESQLLEFRLLKGENEDEKQSC